MPKLPGPIGYAKMMLGAVRDGEAAAARRPIVVCGQPESVEPLRTRLLEGATPQTRAVDVFAMRRLQADDRQALADAEVVVYGGTVVSGLDDATRSDLKVIAKAGRPKLVLLEALELSAAPSLARWRSRSWPSAPTSPPPGWRPSCPRSGRTCSTP
jgi:hypothetical protein